MEGEPDLPPPAADSKFLKPNLSRPVSIHPESISLSRSFNTSTCTSTTSFSSSSPPDLVRQVRAAFKRHRPLGMLKSRSTQPTQLLVPQLETSEKSDIIPRSTVYPSKGKEKISKIHTPRDSVSLPKNVGSITEEIQEDASITQPSEWNSSVNKLVSFNSKSDQPELHVRLGGSYTVASSNVGLGHVPLAEVRKKVHFSDENNATFNEMEWDAGNQVDSSAVLNQEWQHQSLPNTGLNISLKSGDGNSSVLSRRTWGIQDQLLKFENFIQNDLSHARTQSSVVGSSCNTSTLINLSCAPMISSTTYCSQPHQMSSSNLGSEPLVETEAQLDIVHPSYSLKYASESGSHLSSGPSQSISSVETISLDVNKSSALSKEVACSSLKQLDISNSSCVENSAKRHVTNMKSEPLLSKLRPSEAKLENSKLGKLEGGDSGKASTSRKKGYDPDFFFKVNGKLYQRLGKIGSGGSSEVHKVITSDCKIYALKRIKLKGRDYATACGFCQEIEYLNRLKGKNNIIQLIDYEVTDKTLLQELMNGFMSIKDGKVKDEGYIYMVLEYGEIDLAHMLSQKWRELDDSNAIIDENWLRFYWQQILLAVNTIHEERIVHSDLKPANFLLVKGSLKLIDFGIAKAIMSDTTNIQRDSQVGTLSYMSPEAFMCNETDGNGNTIKCGRPSDIWSLGCILYQMVFGRTPFSEYKTFWAKFKIITDPNHIITYEPLSNPLLLDLMKKCLAWDRNERWRIPQLLQHPFLVPPVPPQLPIPPDQNCILVQLINVSGENDRIVLVMCSQLQDMLSDPESFMQSEEPVSSGRLHKILGKLSTLCSQIQDRLETSDKP